MNAEKMSAQRLLLSDARAAMEKMAFSVGENRDAGSQRLNLVGRSPRKDFKACATVEQDDSERECAASTDKSLQPGPSISI